MAIAFVGQGTASVFGITATVTRATTAGNLLVCQVTHNAKSSATITDSAGQSWTLATSTASLGGSMFVSTYYKLASAVTSSVTATVAAGNTSLMMNVSEWSGVGSYRAGNATNATGAAAVTGVVTGDLVLGVLEYFSSGGRIDTVNASYTALTGTNVTTTFASYAYRIATTTATQGPSWTVAATQGVSSAAFAPVNNAPTVDIGVDQLKRVDQQFTFTAAATDDGSIASYAWNFGDGTTGTGSPVNKTYSASGKRTVTCTVTDNGGLTATDTAVATTYPLSAAPVPVRSVTLGSWTVEGSEPSAKIALNDSASNTGVVSPNPPGSLPLKIVAEAAGPGGLKVTLKDLWVEGGSSDGLVTLYKPDGTTMVDTQNVVIPSSPGDVVVTFNVTSLNSSIPLDTDRDGLVIDIRAT